MLKDTSSKRTIGDAITFITASFIGYGWSDIFGVIFIGGPLLVLFVATQIYVRKPADKLRKLSEKIDNA